MFSWDGEAATRKIVTLELLVKQILRLTQRNITVSIMFHLSHQHEMLMD